MTVSLALGFIPLVDAAPLIIASEPGFAKAEGLVLDLRRAASWSMLRDTLDFGSVEVAHMMSVVPVAKALGLGGGAARFGLEPEQAMAKARATFRSDLNRLYLGPEGAGLPRTSDKVEGLGSGRPHPDAEPRWHAWRGIRREPAAPA